MIKNRLIYHKIQEWLIEYIGSEWFADNKIEMTPNISFNDDFNFDVFDESMTTLFIEECFDVTLPLDTESWFTTVNDLVDYIDAIIIELHFATVWNPSIPNFTHSGFAIVDEINALNPSSVLDVGCGKNEFKGKIQNLIGIDPVLPEADIQSTVLQYEPNKTFDVVLVLGSINFGSEEYILSQLEKVISWCSPKGKIYVRVNPGIQNPDSPWMDFFEWDETKIKEYAKKYNLLVSDIREDYNGRLSFVYERG